MQYKNYQISITLEHGYYHAVVTNLDGIEVHSTYDWCYPDAIEVAEQHIDMLLGEPVDNGENESAWLWTDQELDGSFYEDRN